MTEVDGTGHKKCSKCGDVKPHAEFSKKASSRDGLRPQCKACCSASAKTYYRANVDRKVEYHRANQDGIAERKREHRRANIQRMTERDRLYYQANRERIAEQKTEYYQANADRIADRNLLYRFGITPEQYAALLAYQGGKCAGCGVTECPSGKRLSVDHDHACCPPNYGGMTTGACGRCVRGLACITCNTTDTLAGRPPVDWSTVMAARTESI